MLDTELQRIYDSEINVRISWFYDGGIDILLGDGLNGYLAEENVCAMAEIIPWLQEAIAHFYPTSTYAHSLPAELRERAATRLFLPPRVGAQAICPHCGAPNARSHFDELFIFVCARCGQTVTVEEPKMQ
jgi:hypothetical protein